MVVEDATVSLVSLVSSVQVLLGGDGSSASSSELSMRMQSGSWAGAEDSSTVCEGEKAASTLTTGLVDPVGAAPLRIFGAVSSAPLSRFFSDSTMGAHVPSSKKLMSVTSDGALRNTSQKYLGRAGGAREK